MGQVEVDNEQPRQRFRLKCGINDYVPGFEATVRNLVLMQQGHVFDELKTKGHNVARTVTVETGSNRVNCGASTVVDDFGSFS